MSSPGLLRRAQVVLLDPGCFTPFYDRALAQQLAQRGWQVDWITSPWEFEDLAPPPGVRTTRPFFRRLHGRLGRGKRPRRSTLLRRVLKALAYPLGLARVARLLARCRPASCTCSERTCRCSTPGLGAIWRRSRLEVVYTVHDPHPSRRRARRACCALAPTRACRARPTPCPCTATAACDELMRDGRRRRRAVHVDPIDRGSPGACGARARRAAPPRASTGRGRPQEVERIYVTLFAPARRAARAIHGGPRLGRHGVTIGKLVSSGSIIAASSPQGAASPSVTIAPDGRPHRHRDAGEQRHQHVETLHARDRRRGVGHALLVDQHAVLDRQQVGLVDVRQ